jgi:hypothetical protein
MIRALGLLQSLERGGVLVLPFQPMLGHPLHKSPKRAGLTSLSSGSSRLSSIASATN